MHSQRLFRTTTKIASEAFIYVGMRQIPLLLIRNLRARRYIVRMRTDGSARVTIPRGGSAEEARRFVERNITWLERQLNALSAHSEGSCEWSIGTQILFRGELIRIEADTRGCGLLRLGSEIVRFVESNSDLRLAVENHLRRLAEAELPQKVFEYSVALGLTVREVVVRNQRSRWGSCSRRGTISLNWRLIHVPPFVRNYIVIHELMHLREMNHSVRFWDEVRRACPEYKVAEEWLKQHATLIK